MQTLLQGLTEIELKILDVLFCPDAMSGYLLHLRDRMITQQLPVSGQLKLMLTPGNTSDRMCSRVIEIAMCCKEDSPQAHAQTRRQRGAWSIVQLPSDLHILRTLLAALKAMVVGPL